MARKKKSIWILSRGYRRKRRGFQALAAQRSTLSFSSSFSSSKSPSDSSRTTLGSSSKTSFQSFFSDPSSVTPYTIGDEPYELYKRYGSRVGMVVSARRAPAIRRLLAADPQTALIFMDDGFQHRAVVPSFSIVLSTYARPFHTDHLFPWGYLREGRRGIQRADVVVITKCPANISVAARARIRLALKPYLERSIDHTSRFFSSRTDSFKARVSDAKTDSMPKKFSIPLFFAGENYGTPCAFGEDKVLHRSVIAITGLADASTFESYLQKHYHVLSMHRFEDHHVYEGKALLSFVESILCKCSAMGTAREEAVEAVSSDAHKRGNESTRAVEHEDTLRNISFLTTAKDYVKIAYLFEEFPALRRYSWFYIPVSVRILEDENKHEKYFERLLLEAVSPVGSRSSTASPMSAGKSSPRVSARMFFSSLRNLYTYFFPASAS